MYIQPDQDSEGLRKIRQQQAKKLTAKYNKLMTFNLNYELNEVAYKIRHIPTPTGNQ